MRTNRYPAETRRITGKSAESRKEGVRCHAKISTQKGKKEFVTLEYADHFLDILFPPYLGTYVVHSGLNIGCSLGRGVLGWVGSSGVCYAGWLLTSRSDRWWREGGRMGEEGVWAEKRNLGLCTNTHMQGGEKGGVWDRLTTAKERQTLSCT